MKLEEKDFIRIRDYMNQNFGINLEKKATLIEGRLSMVAQKEGFTSFRDYFDSVLKNPDSDRMWTMVAKLTTNYTYFMREPQHYNFLNDIVLPNFKANHKGRQFSIWSAGSSSGEEAYTAAIVVRKFFKKNGMMNPFSITATDISGTVLKMATAGIYSGESLRSLDQQDIRDNFNALADNQYQVKDEVKRLVHFSKFNLMHDFFQFKNKFNIIFCRNVMIYFDHPTRTRVVNKFYDALVPGGHFFIGLSETLSNVQSPFVYVKPAIYRKENV